jgi:hypothetical protein
MTWGVADRVGAGGRSASRGPSHGLSTGTDPGGGQGGRANGRWSTILTKTSPPPSFTTPRDRPPTPKRRRSPASFARSEGGMNLRSGLRRGGCRRGRSCRRGEARRGRQALGDHRGSGSRQYGRPDGRRGREVRVPLRHAGARRAEPLSHALGLHVAAERQDLLLPTRNGPGRLDEPPREHRWAWEPAGVRRVGEADR